MTTSVPVNSNFSPLERLNIRTIAFQRLRQWSLSCCLKFTFKKLFLWQHFICLWINLEEIKSILHFYFESISKWFQKNCMVLNVDKCHFMCLGKDTKNLTFIFSNFISNNCNEEKMLGISIDNKQTFQSRSENRGFIKAIKSPKWFPEKINVQFRSLITVLLYRRLVLEHQIIWSTKIRVRVLILMLC